MHKILHSAITALVVLGNSHSAKALHPPTSPLLKTDTGLTYRAWLPHDFASRRGDVPLIIFSHGFGGCAQQSQTLTASLALAGYAVLAPNHRDEGCDRYRGNVAMALAAGGVRPEKPFTQPQLWTASTESGRRDDVEALLSFALNNAPYKNAIEPERIGLMGHSLGGYIALGIGGAWQGWRDKRVKCVLALSPYAAPFVTHNTLHGIQVPVMFQTGTRDIGIGPVLLKHGGYAQTPGRKYIVVLRGAGHFAWTELNPEFQQTIADYAIAFFDRELMGKSASSLDEPAHGQVSEYRRSR